MDDFDEIIWQSSIGNSLSTSTTRFTRNNDRIDAFNSARVRMNSLMTNLRMTKSLSSRVGGFALRGAARMLGPAGIMATALEVGLKPVEWSFDKSLLRGNIRGALDMLVDEAPSVAEFAVFGAAESAVTGRLGSGKARGAIGKALGKGMGGWKGRAIGFGAGLIATKITSSLFKPIRESLGAYVAEQRSFGAASDYFSVDLAKSSDENFEAARSRLLTMNTAKLKSAKRELSDPVFEGGAWNALFNNKLIKWSEADTAEEKQKMMRMEIRRREEDMSTFISQNNAAIIDYFTRE